MISTEACAECIEELGLSIRHCTVLLTKEHRRASTSLVDSHARHYDFAINKIGSRALKSNILHRLSENKWATFIFATTSAKVDRFSQFFHCYIQNGSAEEALSKTATLPQIFDALLFEV